jgi:tRNA 2-thiouridine synthesizing protein A
VADLRVDAREAVCPIPILKASEALARLEPGQTIELIATDDLALVDVPAWAVDMGYVVEETVEADGEARFVIAKT